MERTIHEVESLLTQLKRMQTVDLAAFAEQHRTLLAICEAYNLVCDAVDSSCRITLEGPDSFLPATPKLHDLIHRSAQRGTLLSDHALHAALLDIRDASQFSQLDPTSFSLVMPLLCSWLSSPANAGKAFTLLHEGVRRLGEHLLGRRDLRCEWRIVSAALFNLLEDPHLTETAGIDPDSVRTIISHIRQAAGL